MKEQDFSSIFNRGLIRKCKEKFSHHIEESTDLLEKDWYKHNHLEGLTPKRDISIKDYKKLLDDYREWVSTIDGAYVPKGLT